MSQINVSKVDLTDNRGSETKQGRCKHVLTKNGGVSWFRIFDNSDPPLEGISSPVGRSLVESREKKECLTVQNRPVSEGRAMTQQSCRIQLWETERFTLTFDGKARRNKSSTKTRLYSCSFNNSPFVIISFQNGFCSKTSVPELKRSMQLYLQDQHDKNSLFDAFDTAILTDASPESPILKVWDECRFGQS